MAAYVLARLPGSALGQRMAERAVRCLRLERDVRGPRLVTVSPAESDAAMQRDGIAPVQSPNRPASCSRSWPGRRCAPGRRSSA